MEWFVKAFLKASLAWLALGATLGLAKAAHPPWTIYRAAPVLAAGGSLSTLGAYLFVYLSWRTVDGSHNREATAAGLRGAAATARRAPLETLPAGSA